MALQKMSFPNGLECYYLSKQETEFIFKEIYVEQEYLRHGISINPGDRIFDVGANIGLFSLYVTQLQRDLSVYAFEPIPEIFEVLQQNINSHRLGNVQLFNYGLSSENNPHKVFCFYPNLAANSTSRPQEKSQQKQIMATKLSPAQTDYLYQSRSVICQLRTLSSVIQAENIPVINLLKIDVEGEEYEVLKGIENQDWSKIQQIVMEIHDQDDRLEQAVTLLLDKGFRVTAEKNTLIAPEMNNFNLYALRSGLSQG